MAADPTQYILSFDYIEFTNQFQILEKSYTSFGETIKKMSAGMTEDLDLLKEQVGLVSSMLAQTGSDLDKIYKGMEGSIKSTSSLLDNLSSQSETINENLSKMGDIKLPEAVSSDKNEDIDTAGERIEDVAPGGVKGLPGEEETEAIKAATQTAEEAKESADKATKEAKEAISMLEKTKQQVDKALKGITNLIKKEVKNAVGSAKSTFGQITGGLLSGGGFLGMIFGFMLLGYKEADRKKKELGEMINTFEGVTDGFFSRTTQKATRWFANFQEKA